MVFRHGHPEKLLQDTAHIYCSSQKWTLILRVIAIFFGIVNYLKRPIYYVKDCGIFVGDLVFKNIRQNSGLRNIYSQLGT